ncbi:MAG: hypothetical protein QNK37_17160 [Acidobacteriota bacterium]|nr:hypothetical protein [Acidobacteriota bacterium]
MEQERPLKERIWEFTKDLSVKVSRSAEKHWKINTLRVEIASIKHRINVKYKELGRYVFDAYKEETLEGDDYRTGRDEIIGELINLEAEIEQREKRIEELEQQVDEPPPSPSAEDVPPPPPPPAPQESAVEEEEEEKAAPEKPAEEESAKAEADSDETKDKGAAESDSAESKA